MPKDCKERSRNRAEMAHNQSARLAELCRWLREMAEQSWNPDIGWVLWHAVQRGHVRVSHYHTGSPIFLVDMASPDQLDGLIRTVRRDPDVAMLNFCVKKIVGFRMWKSSGRKDLRFSILDTPEARQALAARLGRQDSGGEK